MLTLLGLNIREVILCIGCSLLFFWVCCLLDQRAVLRLTVKRMSKEIMQWREKFKVNMDDKYLDDAYYHRAAIMANNDDDFNRLIDESDKVIKRQL